MIAVIRPENSVFDALQKLIGILFEYLVLHLLDTGPLFFQLADMESSFLLKLSKLLLGVLDICGKFILNAFIRLFFYIIFEEFGDLFRLMLQN